MAALFVVAASTTAASQTETQHGSKLVGTGTQGPSEQGWSVALSADGSIAIMGGIVDNKLTGAAWVFRRSGDTWSQQGTKLVGTGVIGQAGQGVSVALSADGETAMVGGPYDNSRTGAAWVFKLSSDTWSQQGNKLVGNGSDGKAAQGASVALSADGNTAIVGGPHDDSKAGAAWVFTRSGDVWSQEGKLVGTGAAGNAGQGSSVALSADGNTAIVGGPGDNSAAGAAWVFTRSKGVWKQLGNKLVGTGAAGKAWQGFSVALSADGKTALVGGPGDNSNVGAAWVFSRSGAEWSQQSGKLVATDVAGSAKHGYSVALSADGKTAMVGGPYDNSYAGAVWAYGRNRTAWSQQHRKLVGPGATGRAEQGFSVALSADGSTAIAGGIVDNKLTGAAWVHSRSVWAPTSAPFVGYGF
jgi:antibiotic biosynthesis monooxygenase (ABM) superfamily enzyme